MTALREDTATAETPSRDDRLWEAEGAVVFSGDGDPRTPETTLRRLAELGGPSIEADSYSRGGVVEKLEIRFAEMLGKESAVFMPSGTLANHLAVRQLCWTRQKAIVQEQSHLFNDSGDCVTRLSGITLVPLAPGQPSFTVEELEQAVERSGDARVASPIGAVMVESPVRRQSGQVVPFEQMRAITVNGGEIMYHQGGSRAEIWRLKTVPPIAFNQERPNLTEGGLDVQGGNVPPCSQGLHDRRDERSGGCAGIRAAPGHSAQDARVLGASGVSTGTSAQSAEARSI